MADLKFEALLALLENQKELLASQNPRDKSIKSKMDVTIKGLKEQYAAAKNDKERADIYNGVADFANSLKAAGAATGALITAVKSGDPFAISASSLELAASLVSTISLAGGPIGAAVGAVVGAVLSIVSMILGLFQEEFESLISQIEKLMRNLKAEDQIKDLRTARDHIRTFSNLAVTINTRNVEAAVKAIITSQPYTPLERRKFSVIQGQLNQNTMSYILGPKNWLLDDNKELSLWTEVLSLVCQLYGNYKLAIVSWLPLVAPDDPRDDAMQMLMDWRDENDNVVLDFLEAIKPAARNRGIIFHAGQSGIFVRDVVVSGKAKWTDLTGDTHAIAAAYRPGQVASPHPLLSILHLGHDEKFDHSDRSRLNENSWRSMDAFETYLQSFGPEKRKTEIRHEIIHALQHPFSKKKPVYDMNGQWNGELLLDSKSKKSEWNQLGNIGEIYDIWAIPGTSTGEISVYTSTGDTIKDYVVRGGVKNVREFERVNGSRVGAVRAVRTKMPKPDGETDLNWNLAVYGLSGFEGTNWWSPFEILAFLPPPKLKGRILPPVMFNDGPKGPDWRKYPVGIAVDSVRLWVFGTSFIACATHTAVKLCLEQQKSPGQPVQPAWTTYRIPQEVLGYDPGQRVFMGLRDLSACDDGTLTAVFDETGVEGIFLGAGRIFTATTQFEPGQPIIKPGLKLIVETGHYIETHGWQKDPQAGDDPLKAPKRVGFTSCPSSAGR